MRNHALFFFQQLYFYFCFHNCSNMFQCPECKQATRGIRLRRGGARLPGVYAGPNMVRVSKTECAADFEVGTLGLTWRQQTIDAVAFPLPNGDFFVTRGTLVGKHYPVLVEQKHVFFARAETQAPCIPVLVLSSGLDTLTPDEEKVLQFRAWDLLPTRSCEYGSGCKGGATAVRYRQSFCEIIEPFVAAPRVFLVRWALCALVFSQSKWLRVYVCTR